MMIKKETPNAVDREQERQSIRQWAMILFSPSDTTPLPIFFEHPTLQCTKRCTCPQNPAARVVRCIPLHSTLLRIAVIFFKAPDPIYSAHPYNNPSHYIATFLSYSPTVRSLYLLTACSNDLILTVRPCSALRCTSTSLHWSRSPASLPA